MLMSAQIVWLHPTEDKSTTEIDLVTAVDVAIRDLQEIESQWGTQIGLGRLRECRELLVQAFANPCGLDGRRSCLTED
jgi:hypothetical protein